MKTYEAQSISGNHDIDYRVDEAGQITAMRVKSIVVYSDGSEDLRRREEVDVWPLLNIGQQITAQIEYDLVVALFNAEFLS